MPARSSSMANSTRRMEFLAHRPISINRPISAGRSSALPNNNSDANAPIRQSGSAAMITTGLKKPRNNRTRTPKVSPIPAKRSEEHTSELQSLMRISYAVFYLKKKKNKKQKLMQLLKTEYKKQH